MFRRTALLALAVAAFTALAAPTANAQRLVAQASPTAPTSTGISQVHFDCVAVDPRAVAAKVHCFTNHGADVTRETIVESFFAGTTPEVRGPAARINETAVASGGIFGGFRFCAVAEFTFADLHKEYAGSTVSRTDGTVDPTKCAGTNAGFSTVVGF